MFYTREFDPNQFSCYSTWYLELRLVSQQSFPPSPPPPELLFRPSTTRFCSSQPGDPNALEIVAIKAFTHLYAPPQASLAVASPPHMTTCRRTFALFLDMWLLCQSKNLEFLGFLSQWLFHCHFRCLVFKHPFV